MLGRPRKIQVFESCLQRHMAREAEDLDRPSSFFVRLRQIVEHSQLTKVGSSPKHLYMLSLLKKVWLLTVFEETLESFEQEYYESNVDIGMVCYKVAARYLYQLFQLNEFVREGYRNLGMIAEASQCRLGDLLRSSDEALFESLECITAKKQFNQHDELLEDHALIHNYCRYKYDLLKSFPAKSLEFGVFANREYLYQDLIYIIGRAEQQFENFRQDMEDVLGYHAKCRLKICREANNSYNLNGVRKLLSRWLVNLITNDKEVIQSRAYQAFFQNKRKALDLFYVNSTTHSQSAQEQIIENMLELLTNSVYEGNRINEDFGLYIYDLLKAKLKVKSIQHIDHLLEKIQTMRSRRSHMQVFRVENRLLNHHRDVLINVKYGGFATGEIKLLLMFSGDEREVKRKQMEFEHKKFLYNLSRSIFGPTIELVITYEAQRMLDAPARMHSLGRVTRRTDPIPGIDFTEMFCPSRHRLLKIQRQRNHLEIGDELCRHCFQLVRSQLLLLCHQCNMFYCENCMYEFERRGIKFIRNESSVVRTLTDLSALDALTGYSLLMLHLDYSPASRLMQRYLQFIGSHLHHRTLSFYVADMTTSRHAFAFANQYDIKRFPAFLVLHNGVPFKILVGASIYKLFDLISMLREESIVKRCPHNHEMIEVRPSAYLNWHCSECSRQRDSSDESILYCRECLYQCCKRCSFSNTNFETFQDQRGISYLSTALVREGFNYCRNSHRMTIAHRNPFSKVEYTCERCGVDFFFMDEFGMYWCQHCLVMLCSGCADHDLLELLHTKELANHDINPYMMDYPTCSLCRRHYKMKSDLPTEEFWCCDICRKELQRGRQYLECEDCEMLVCQQCFDKLKEDMLSRNLLNDLRCQCERKLRRAALLTHTNSRLFNCTVCHQAYYYNTPHYECENYGEDCLFVLCSDCARNTRLHVRVHCFKQSFSRDSKVRSFNLNVPRRLHLRELKQLMEEQGLIARGCGGRFKTKEGWFSSNLDEQNKLETFGTHCELYYFESLDIYDLTIAVETFEKSAVTRKNKRKESFEDLKMLRTIRPGEQRGSLLPPPELSNRASSRAGGPYRTLLLPALEDQANSKDECCKPRGCATM